MLEIFVLSLLLSVQSAPRHCSDPPPPPTCYVEAGELVCFPADEPECIPDDVVIVPGQPPDPPCSPVSGGEAEGPCTQK